MLLAPSPKEWLKKYWPLLSPGNLQRETASDLLHRRSGHEGVRLAHWIPGAPPERNPRQLPFSPAPEHNGTDILGAPRHLSSRTTGPLFQAPFWTALCTDSPAPPMTKPNTLLASYALPPADRRLLLLVLHAFRTLDASLAGQDYRLAPADRVCPFCASAGSRIIEDEYHVLAECPLYHAPRERFTAKLQAGLPAKVAGCKHGYDIYGLALSPCNLWHFQILTKFLRACVALRTIAPVLQGNPEAQLATTHATGMRELPWTRISAADINDALAALRTPWSLRHGWPALQEIPLAHPVPTWLRPRPPPGAPRHGHGPGRTQLTHPIL